MSEIKHGDRVRVEFEGEVSSEPHPEGTFRVRVATRGWEYAWVRPDRCTVIVPPIKVGDVVTADNIGQLGERSVIARPRLMPWFRTFEGTWTQDGALSSSTDDEVLKDGSDDLIVLRIGGGS